MLSGCSVYDADLLVHSSPESTKVARGAAMAGPHLDDQAERGDGDVVSDSVRPTASDTAVEGPDPDAGPAENVNSAHAQDARTGRAAAPGADECPPNVDDCCPNDPNKTAPGACGCGEPDVDYDADALFDCDDPAPRGWLRRLTFDGSQVPGKLTDFPLLVRVIDAHLGVFAARDARDVHFVAADGSTLLDHEVERFDAARGDLTAWVRMPSLESGSDTVLYLAYADGQAHRNQADKVWSDHRYVWHLADDLSASDARVQDSTDHAHAMPRGAMTSANSRPGVAGMGIDFDGKDDELRFTNDVLGDTPSTFQAWVIQRQPPAGSLGSAILMLGDQSSSPARFLLSLEQETGAVKYGFSDNVRGGVAIAIGVWRQLVWTWDGQRSSLFINGKLVEGPSLHTGAGTSGQSGRIGSASFDSPRLDFFLAGTLDEVRVSTVARSREWIATEYANQRPDSTFLKAMDEPEPAH